MHNLAKLEELLEQIRALPSQDREYIEAELVRDAYEHTNRNDSPALTAELKRRAEDALAHPDRGVSRQQAVAGARWLARLER